MASYFSATTISPLCPRAKSCGHILTSTVRVTRSRSGASHLSRQHHRQVSAAPSLCGLCHQRLVLSHLFDRQMSRVAKIKAGLRRGQGVKKEDRLRRSRARAALANCDVRIELWEEEDQHQHLQHHQDCQKSSPPSDTGRHYSAIANCLPPPPPKPSSPFSSSSPSPQSSSSRSPFVATTSSSSYRARRAAFDPAQEHRAPSSYRSGERGRHSLSRRTDIYRPGRHALPPEALEDTSFYHWSWKQYHVEMWWRRAEERFGPVEDWPLFFVNSAKEKHDEWWTGGSNWLDEMDQEERMHEQEEESAGEEGEGDGEGEDG